MEQNEIIRMAKESGAVERYFGNQLHGIAFHKKEWLERFAALVAEHWIETNKALAKEIIELKKQAEHELVGYFAYDEEHDIWEELTGPNAPGATKLYAAPVRTKDLTDDDIFKTNKTELPDCQDLVDFARAVIAAFKEKNK